MTKAQLKLNYRTAKKQLKEQLKNTDRAIPNE